MGVPLQDQLRVQTHHRIAAGYLDRIISLAATRPAGLAIQFIRCFEQQTGYFLPAQAHGRLTAATAMAAADKKPGTIGTVSTIP